MSAIIYRALIRLLRVAYSTISTTLGDVFDDSGFYNLQARFPSADPTAQWLSRLLSGGWSGFDSQSTHKLCAFKYAKCRRNITNSGLIQHVFQLGIHTLRYICQHLFKGVHGTQCVELIEDQPKSDFISRLSIANISLDQQLPSAGKISFLAEGLSQRLRGLVDKSDRFLPIYVRIFDGCPSGAIG